MLYFDHADILFRQIIGEGDLEIVEKSEHPVFVVLQTIKQVLGLGLFFAASFYRGIKQGEDGRIDLPSLTKNSLILPMPLIQTFKGKTCSKRNRSPGSKLSSGEY